MAVRSLKNVRARAALKLVQTMMTNHSTCRKLAIAMQAPAYAAEGASTHSGAATQIYKVRHVTVCAW